MEMGGPPLPGAARDALGSVLRFIGSHPIAAAALVGGSLVLFAGTLVLIRRYRSPAGTALQRVLAGRDAIAILLHPNPDPDAMGAALGVRELAADVGVDATLHYPGEIRHQENRAFRTVLDVDLNATGRVSELPGAVVLVDHNEPRGIEGAGVVDPLVVVDHHPGGGTGRRFTDVRPEYGACSTVVTEYLQAAGFEPATGDTDPAKPLPPDVATGLLYGILSDTDSFTRGCAEADFDASAFLHPAVDEEWLDRIANPETDAEVLEVKARAIEEREVKGPFAVSYVGEISNVDAIPQAADELLLLEGVTAVVVSGRKDGALHVSGRSRDDRVHMGEVLEQAVADIPMAGAGGHSCMGGGQLSLEHMSGLGPSEGISIGEFNDRLFAAMAGKS
ncbi:MAG: bifunctional oligoribonuclease/PAP phosphatase NrnA [Halodesulfurarchaeum sp.]